MNIFKRKQKRREDREWEWTLATYNGERARGLVHTEEWRDWMTKLQDRFDKEQRDE